MSCPSHCAPRRAYCGVPPLTASESRGWTPSELFRSVTERHRATKQLRPAKNIGSARLQRAVQAQHWDVHLARHGSHDPLGSTIAGEKDRVIIEQLMVRGPLVNGLQLRKPKVELFSV